MTNGYDWRTQLALGAAAGFVGTLMLQVMRSANQRWLPHTMPPIRKDPGQFMVETVEQMLLASAPQQIPDSVESGAAKMLAAGYGITFGALYATYRPEGGPAVEDGTVLGIAAWAAGYLGWLPALGLMPPVWRQDPAQVLLPVAQHVLYGIATVAAYDWLREEGTNSFLSS
jgi:hypothetical protein